MFSQLPLRIGPTDVEVTREPHPSHLSCPFSCADTNWSDCLTELHLSGSRKSAKKVNDMRSGALRVVGTVLQV